MLNLIFLNLYKRPVSLTWSIYLNKCKEVGKVKIERGDKAREVGVGVVEEIRDWVEN